MHMEENLMIALLRHSRPAAAALFAGLLSCTWASADTCNYSRQTPIAFTDNKVDDQLRISVSGSNCDDAELSIQLITDTGVMAYDYSGRLVEHMPFGLSGQGLAVVVPTYINALLTEASQRNTRDLPAYTDTEQFYAATNDFVTIDAAAYDELRQQQRAVLWHTTGDASWVHLVYDGTSGKSKVIMRGGVFTQ